MSTRLTREQALWILTLPPQVKWKQIRARYQQLAAEENQREPPIELASGYLGVAREARPAVNTARGLRPSYHRRRGGTRPCGR